MGGRILRPSLYRTIKVVMSDGSTFHVPSAVRLVSNTLQLERDTANHPAYQVCMQTCLRRHTSILHALQSTKIDVHAEGGVVSLRAHHHLSQRAPSTSPQGLSNASSLMSRREEARLARLQRRDAKKLFDD